MRCDRVKTPGELIITDKHAEFKTSSETIVLKDIRKKVMVNPMEILLEVKIKDEYEWIGFKVSNISEKEEFVGFKDWFKDVETSTSIVHGHDLKNRPETVAFFESDGTFVIGSFGNIHSCVESDLTMCVIQRNSPGTSRFDMAWCFQRYYLIRETTFDKKDLQQIIQFCSEVTDHVYDNGAEPYDWKHFLKVQKQQNGDVDDWLGVFNDSSDEDEEEEEEEEDYETEDSEEEEEEEEEEEDEEEFSDSELSNCSWESGTSTDTDENERPSKKTKLH